MTQIRISFCGYLNTKAIAELTSIFSRYSINIIDICMSNIKEESSTLNIICQSSSTTDEIDSFWNDITLLSKELNLIYSKQYLQ